MRSLRKGTPEGGECSRPDSFSYTPVLHGLKNAFSAWVAGPCYWCEEAHEHKPPHLIGSVPCLHWMTRGTLKCARCRKQPQTTVLGWLPLWREQDHKAILVILHKNAADLVRELQFQEFVSVGRVDSVSSIYVRRAESKLVMRTDNEYRKRAVDVTDDLLVMWKLPDLNEWLKSGPAEPAAPTAPEAPAAEKPKKTRPRGPVERMNAAQERANDEFARNARRIIRSVDDVFGAAPSANGKHTTEGEGG